MTESMNDSCNAPLHPRAAEGLRLFNAGKYFEAHEALEDAWNAEKGEVRELVAAQDKRGQTCQVRRQTEAGELSVSEVK